MQIKHSMTLPSTFQALSDIPLPSGQTHHQPGQTSGIPFHDIETASSPWERSLRQSNELFVALFTHFKLLHLGGRQQWL